jgi:enhancing lycopene biosynthesis protein 2
VPKVAVCLSGCGFLDGAEIHEATLTLLCLDQAGAQILCCAPDIPQAAVVDHVRKAPAPVETRNVLVEAARIARGNIQNLAHVTAAQIDAIIFPGGFGAATNLCNFAQKGPKCTVNPEVERLVLECIEARKPIGAICIAPAMLARVLGNNGVKARLTIGTDPDTAGAIKAMGQLHIDCPVGDHVVDEDNRIVTTPAYMLGKGPADVYDGIRKCVAALLKMIS